jgi:transcriptional regulator of arginine metabolism
MSRSDRLKAIKEIVNNRKVSSQEEIRKELEKAGYKVTQSTISRDLGELRLYRVRNCQNQEYYSLEKKYSGEGISSSEKFKSRFRESVISISRANNIIVLRTYPGEAQGTAAVIDGMNFVEILGTVAGDDTIICILDNGENAKNMLKIMELQ